MTVSPTDRSSCCFPTTGSSAINTYAMCGKRSRNVAGGVVPPVPPIVPNTVATENRELHPDAESPRWCKGKYDERATHTGEARADQGEIEFKFGSSLRVTWCTSQRAGPSSSKVFGHKAMMEKACRVVPDWSLERAMPDSVTGLGQIKWVPIVPEGYAAGSLPWKDGYSCSVTSAFSEPIATPARRLC